jgi:hypothetical protein
MPIFEGDIQSGPALNAIAITPNDGANFSFGQCRSIYVGGTGAIVLDTPYQTNVTFTNVAAGVPLAVAAVRVRATGTTATGLIGLY